MLKNAALWFASTYPAVYPVLYPVQEEVVDQDPDELQGHDLGGPVVHALVVHVRHYEEEAHRRHDEHVHLRMAEEPDEMHVRDPGSKRAPL